MQYKAELHAMEVYAKTLSLIFIPFRNISNFRNESGKFLPGFQTLLSRPPKEFIDVHRHVLKNIQNCRNSMNAGRPLDALERVTMKPDIPEQERAKNEKDDKSIDIYESLISNLENAFTGNFNYRTEDNIEVRDCGSFECGRNLLQTPVVGTNANIII